MSVRLAVGLVAGVAVVLSAGACGAEDPVYAVHLLEVSNQAERWSVEAAEADLAAQRAFLRVDGFEVSPEPGPDVLGVQVIYGELSDGTGDDPLLVHVAMQIPEDLRGKLRPNTFDATVLVSRDVATADPPAEVLELAVARAARVLEARVDLARGRLVEVDKLLGSEDAELVLLALEWLRDHPDPRHVRSALDLLDHEDGRVTSLAIETVGALGGPEHVRPLLRNLRLSNVGHMHRAYDALGTLGGDDAITFLEFAARNEEDPERRAMAEDALGRARQPRTPDIYATSLLQGHRR